MRDAGSGAPSARNETVFSGGPFVPHPENSRMLVAFAALEER